ncbi:anti-sigma factor [Anaerohalosphaera lusitana]|uniref:Anti-sigma factor n=1 Tax=Anaerohalosphaera lusitana TaxID=1936003 RepID=A0A1U9NM41_9BACT|nr:hypothetical protein [Anaerohalosphaera lusitana]AQT68660.1 anti-sigma factor [Anaerohalosphaera lusitana]
MVDNTKQPLCDQAAIYLYDYLSKDLSADVPPEMRTHIDSCPYCQQQLKLLKQACAADIDESVDGSPNPKALNEMLSLHFEFAGREVRCRDAKPFLPSLADHELRARIVTPITAHVEHCPQCLDDLKTIAQLNLTGEQYGHLSRLLTGDENIKPQSCSDVTEHIENRICEAVPYAGLFNSCFEHNEVPASDQPKDALTDHIENCPACLQKMHELHSKIVAMADRPDSGIVTELTIEDAANDEDGAEPADVLPVHIEVRDDSQNPGEKHSRQHTGKTAAKLQRFNHGKQLMKAAVFLGAVLLIGWSLISVNTAQATDLEKIKQAMAKARNVHMAKHHPYTEEVIYEKWYSQELGIYILKNSDGTKLVDLEEKINIMIDSGGNIEKTKASDGDIENAKRQLRNGFGLVPFSETEKDKNLNWQQISSDERTKTYARKYKKEQYSGPPVPYESKFVVEADTLFPIRYESYSKTRLDRTMSLKTLITAEQISTEQMQKVIDDICL